MTELKPEWLSSALCALGLWKEHELGVQSTWVRILALSPIRCNKPTTSTFSRSHALRQPWGVNQVNHAASLGICSVSSGIFHGDVSPRQVYGWSWLSALKTLIMWWNKNVILPTINKPQWRFHSTPPHNPPPLKPTFNHIPKIQIISLESDTQQNLLLLIKRVTRACLTDTFMFCVKSQSLEMRKSHV